MSSLQMPTHEHTQFDSLCEPLGDYERLPAVVAEPPKFERELPAENEDASLDGLILAGLVAPH